MTLRRKTVPIKTYASGDFTGAVSSNGDNLVAVDFTLGTLATPNVTITDHETSVDLLDLVSPSSGRFYPSATYAKLDGTDVDPAAVRSPAVMDGLDIVVASGGDTK